MERLPLPSPRGELSDALLRYLTGTAARLPTRFVPPADPLGDDDLHLALFCAYELHHRGLQQVPDDLEWDTGVLVLRAAMERTFEGALHDALDDDAIDDVVPDDTAPVPVSRALQQLVDDAQRPLLSRYMAECGTRVQMRELLAHRSAYQLKEADGHTWAIPRFGTRSRTALVAIQFDEYGNGRAGQSHHELFGATMRGAGLDARYGAHVDALPGSTLATVNLLSCLGLHRRHLGALVGHLAVFEMTSVVPMQRYSEALRRLGIGAAARRFYDVHVEADAAHAVIAARDLADRFVAERPHRRAEILFGARALLHVEARFAAAVLDAFVAGRSSLRAPIDAADALAGVQPLAGHAAR